MEQSERKAVEALGLDAGYEAWLSELDAVGRCDPLPEPKLPDPEGCAEALARLGCSASDVYEVVASLPDPQSSPALWWLLKRCHKRIMLTMGDPKAPDPFWPKLPEGLGSPGRCFYLHVFLAVLSEIRSWHDEEGIPEEISWATLADLGRHVAIHRRVKGGTGIDVPWWMTLHLRGLLYELGRLQYRPFYIGVGSPDPWYSEAEATSRGLGFRYGDAALDLHIPEGMPLSPGACDGSLDLAREFFSEHFAVGGRRIVICSSWLLDDQLADYLPTDSNIVRFQRRFELVPRWVQNDRAILTFVFRKEDPVIEELPQRTKLERAVVYHLRDGGHWRVRTGWMDLTR